VVSGFSFSRLGLVGAVGIELLFNSTKSRVFTVLPTAIQMNWSQMELSWAEFQSIELHLDPNDLTRTDGFDASEGSRQEPLQVG